MDDVLADINNRSFENFIFAEERFRKVGLEEPHMVEHTAGASLSQYYAVAAWAAARLYSQTKEERFADFAVEYANQVVACQEQGTETPLNGYFYRDELKKHIVHFSHQARDQVFVMALDAVCRGCDVEPCFTESMHCPEFLNPYNRCSDK